MSNTTAALKAKNLHKHFTQGEQHITVLSGTELEVELGEMVAVVGRSGSGKSTLLHVLAGLDTPDQGEVWVDETDLVAADNNQRAAVRAEGMGFVYQNHHLLPEFSAWENVAMPLRIGGDDLASSKASALALLGKIGLQDRVEHLPSQLSGGERQRVAVARAVAGSPKIVLADEPTGNLDKQNADEVIELIQRLARERSTAFLVVTHDEGMLPFFDRVLRLDNGSLKRV